MEEPSFEVKPVELRHFKDRLLYHFNKGEWGRLNKSLEKLGELSERSGQLELCLRTQTMKIWAHDQMRSRCARPPDGEHPTQALFKDLLARLDHLQWRIG